ncbi:MAG: type II toxin-antitoxin system RelE/ParE family toxin [Clostridiales Family XIII bacterium]|jgi:plasmid stabilization system protein ParE|nr:type II toxin-antitoxin system RelE/ParE family toxin [Clostridiales Family XIII bacterium]
MDYKVVVTKPAEYDLGSIISYLANNLYNKRAASGLLNQFDKQVSGLRAAPRLYGLSQNPRLRKKGYHKMLISGYNYLALYRVNDATATVSIMRLFYMRQNYEDLV